MTAEFAFHGFPQETLRFYRELKANNNREWFQAHKEEYEKYVLLPASAFVVTLGRRLKELHEDLHYDPRTNGRGSLMRIYRDLRFSKDKTPYKTRMGVRFWLGQKGGSGPSPGYFLHIEPSHGEVYSGMHGFPKPVLEAYRAAAADDEKGRELQDVLKDLRDQGYEVGGESLKRVPRGYDPDHAHAALLRYKSLYARGPRILPEVITSPAFVDVSFSQSKAMWPLNRWLAALSS